jgi:dynein intermediate chain
MEMERRKEELEKKRQKLAELRRAREERKQVFSSAVQKQEEKPAERSRKETLDDLITSLLKDKPAGDQPGTPKSDDAESEKGVASHHARHSSISTGYGISPGTSVPQSPSIAAPSRYIPEFSSFEAVILDIAPKELILYSKEVQTTEKSFGPPPPSEEEIRAKILKEQEEKEKVHQATLEEERLRMEDEKKKMLQLKDISEENRKKILSSNEFVEFFDHSTKIVERALNENYDFMKDYSIIKDNENDDQSGSRVKYLHSFFDDRWTKNRSVTDVNWSRRNPELCVASYNKNPVAVNEPDGVALIWNSRLLERPEYVFHSQSDVLTTMFSEFHPTLVIGGTYSGQIVLWDMRQKSLPVLKTPLSASGHTHPVYSMQMVGTQNAHNLITASTDGLICSWQLDMLAQPQVKYVS